jgi:predicted nuclease with TOPRIM domain
VANCSAGVQDLQQQLAEALSDNEALRSELAAFDPEFWEELENLKYERQQLAETVQRYEQQIHGLPRRPGHR